jgi:hypothetical protein
MKLDTNVSKVSEVIDNFSVQDFLVVSVYELDR